MKLTLTIADLERFGACEEGIATFRETYGESAELDWTREAQIATLRGPLGRYLVWAWWVGLIPWWSMCGANLRGVDLSRASLSWANLSGADLSKANLSWADLRGADLRGVDLSRADLREANLSRANLSWANLCGANLSGADLSKAELSKADLSGANLSWADLREAQVCLCAVCQVSRDIVVAAGWSIDQSGKLDRTEAVQ